MITIYITVPVYIKSNDFSCAFLLRKKKEVLLKTFCKMVKTYSHQIRGESIKVFIELNIASYKLRRSQYLNLNLYQVFL